MAYTAGEAKNIIVGAAAIFVGATDAAIPEPAADTEYVETLSATPASTSWRNVGYTSNGLELQFAPEFGEVQVDQVLDVAKMFKSGMTVTLNTSMAEATLENLAFALALDDKYTFKGAAATTHGIVGSTETVPGTPDDVWGADATGAIDLSAGKIGECAIEKKLIAVGAGGGDCAPGFVSERIYVALRVLSIESVTLSQKRDEATTYDVSFRLLPKNGLYGQIVDRTVELA
jgi:hypothetical protein